MNPIEEILNALDEQGVDYEYIDGNSDNCAIAINGQRILIKIQ